ncbi:MAG TPA: TetR/AcrR family transcriptional regulator [Microbacteriaceae bacterium]|nr:TetR/AcrR family transcriptional regulator [Microbacteriaceae bacterium]
MGGSGGAAAASARPPRNRKGVTRAPLSRHEVVETALRLIDEHGFYELSMRGLARELGVFPAAVYWHAGTKSELLALVSERVMEEIELPDESLDWQDWMLDLGLRVRSVLGHHPRFASYFITNIQINGRMLVLADATIGTLSRAGFRNEELIYAYNALFGAAFSWTAGEFAEEMDPRHDGDGKAQVAARLAEAGADEFVNVRAHWSVVADRVYGVRWRSGRTRPMDASFERMLRTLIAGFAAQLESPLS